MEDDYFNGSDDDECYGDQDEDYFDFVDLEDQFVSSENTSCKVIRKETLLAAQKVYLQRVMDLLSLREHQARTLLIHYRWDVEKIDALFVDRSKEWLYDQVGLLAEERKDIISSDKSLSTIKCLVCFEEVPANESSTMECGHCFCNNCWTEHFTVMIIEGKSRRITCMAHKCFAICDEGTIRNLVGSRDFNLAEKFDRFLLESYIDDNKNVKWCPSVPHCGNAIRIDDNDELYEVECACGKQFCFSCMSEPHSPCSCEMRKLWMLKCENESETVNWITVHTKYCPTCIKPVEKNGGCNLVACICGQYFCWLCGEATGGSHTWHSIRGHTCGRYKEDQLAKMERAKKELHRYTHYFNRYKAHTDSSKLEANMMNELKSKLVSLEGKPGYGSEDFNDVHKGLLKLFRSRRILSYSYVFAYYMFGNELFKNKTKRKEKEKEKEEKEKEIMQNLFEDQQQQFELNVERLSSCLEEPFDEYCKDKFSELRLKIVTLSVVIDDLCKKMYEFIENDLLAPPRNERHPIAPYRRNGVLKASEFIADVK